MDTSNLEAVRAYFTDPVVRDATAELEMSIAATRKRVFHKRDVVELMTRMDPQRAWFFQAKNGAYSVFHDDNGLLQYDVVERFFAADHQRQLEITMAMPFTLALLLGNLAADSVITNDLQAIELLLASPTFCDFFSHSDRQEVVEVLRRGCVSTDMMNVLLSHGADANNDILKALVSISNGDGGDEVVACFEANGVMLEGFRGIGGVDATMLELVRLGADFEVFPNETLFVATRHSKLDLVRSLLADGFIDVDIRDSMGRTALTVAIASSLDALMTRAMPTVEMLLFFGADPNVQDQQGQTPAYHAVARCNYELLALLLKHGADPNIPDQNGNTPLHRISFCPTMLPLANVLLLHGADPNARAKNGKTPLHELVEILFGCSDLVATARTFLEHGADPNVFDDSGVTPLEICRRSRVSDGVMLVELLQ